ncbi:NAD-dependent epimerase/dehydratase family protein [Streptomyces sp. NPDC003691]
MNSQRLLITGGTGFVGSHVVSRLLTHAPGGTALRLLTHRRSPEHATGRHPVEHIPGSLSDPASLHGICDGVTTVLHLAARIDGTEAECRAVNSDGTHTLLAEAERAGVQRFVQLGTAAVYAGGPHRGAAEGFVPEHPTSPTSITRLEGERLVLAAGGTVLRPYLIYGTGDTWMVPGLVGLIRRMPHWVDGGRARLSLVAVDRLAAAVSDLALLPHLPAGRVLHASHPEPVSVRDLVSTVTGELGLPAPEGECTTDEAAAMFTAPEDALLRRRLAMVTVDRWYDSDQLWKLVAADPGPAFADDFARHGSWYRSHLG